MPYILFSEQEKQSANASDIRAFLASLGQEVKRSGREYTWESPSGKVSINGSEWYSQYERVGGGAVSFVQKFFGASYHANCGFLSRWNRKNSETKTVSNMGEKTK